MINHWLSQYIKNANAYNSVQLLTTNLTIFPQIFINTKMRNDYMKHLHVYISHFALFNIYFEFLFSYIPKYFYIRCNYLAVTVIYSLSSNDNNSVGENSLPLSTLSSKYELVSPDGPTYLYAFISYFKSSIP